LEKHIINSQWVSVPLDTNSEILPEKRGRTEIITVSKILWNIQVVLIVNRVLSSNAESSSKCQSFYMKLFQLLCELRKNLLKIINENRTKIKAKWHKQIMKTIDAICHCNHLTSQR